jgi:myo-inositol-1-phosphate synthase
MSHDVIRKKPAEVRVAIVGVGNCAASLVQRVHYYRDADPGPRCPV